MAFSLAFTAEAENQLAGLVSNPKKLKKVRKALAFLEVDPRYPSLQTHKFHGLTGPNGEEVFEAYAENDTPGAYRIFFYYNGPGAIVILLIIPHP